MSVFSMWEEREFWGAKGRILGTELLCPSQNAYGEALIFYVMVFGDGPFGK